MQISEAGVQHLLRPVERLGRALIGAVTELGYLFALLFESCSWIVTGCFRHQPVRISAVFAQMMNVGITAVPIVFVLSFAVGIMLAIQGIHTLKTFGAEQQVVVGIALSVVREFGPLITAILMAGRSGSALAARIGTMLVSQEIDALRVMGINPVRYLVSPVLLAMLVMVPSLTFFADLAGLLGAAIYCQLELGLGLHAFLERGIQVLSLDDLQQGFIKSVVFAFIITVVGVSNGFMVQGGAEGVGKATTRAVVLSITCIVIADMLFTFILNH